MRAARARRDSAATGRVHGLAMPLGGQFNVPHGVANAAMLPHVMRFNLVSAVERYRDIAEALGEVVTGCSPRRGAELAVEAVERLSADIGVPGLRQLGIPEDAIDALAADGMTNTRQILPNPRAVRHADLAGILAEAFRK